MGMVPTGKAEIEEANGGGSWQEEDDLVIPFHGNFWARSGRRALYHGHPDLGRGSLGRQLVYRTKRSMDEADLGGSDVETSEVTCRSCHV